MTTDRDINDPNWMNCKCCGRFTNDSRNLGTTSRHYRKRGRRVGMRNPSKRNLYCSECYRKYRESKPTTSWRTYA